MVMMVSNEVIKHKLLSVFLFLILSGLLLLFSESNLLEASPYHLKTVVIDAGHGGHDAGCLGSSSKEKHVALEIALRLGKLIEQNYPDVKVIYTRTKDVFIELHERAAIANRAKADLFICIHANSSEASTAFGTETFVMGLHKTKENLTVARRENSAILYEKDYKNKYDGYDPNSPEAHIIFNLFQKAYMDQSLLFAAKIQNEFEEYAGRFNRGVKQAGFLVLYRTAMPGVLIETGFLSNKAEEKYLNSEKGRDDMATSIFRAFRSYKIDMEQSGKELMTDKPASPKPGSKPAVNKITEEKETPEKNAVDPLKPVKENPPSPLEEQPKKTDLVKPVPEKTQLPDFFYTVQIGAVASNTEINLEPFQKINALPINGDDGFTRFTVGRFNKLSEAINQQIELRNQGYKDAFVTPYYKGKRISLKEAAALSK